MRRIQLNSVQLNAVQLNGIGECQRGSHAGAPPVVPDVPDIPDIPEEPDVPSDPDVDEDGYIIFADPEVQRICAENWGDGTGITEAQAASVTNLNKKFASNANITSFNELEYFIGLTSLKSPGGSGQFRKCTSLASVKLPNTCVEIGDGAFRESGVEYINLENIRIFGVGAFFGCKIKKAILPNVEALNGESSNGVFYKCSSLEKVFLGSQISFIGTTCFAHCTLLNYVVIAAPIPPTLQSYVFTGSGIAKKTGLIYVPDGTTTDAGGNTITIVEAYKAATNWSEWASRIFPISQLATDNPELYAEIEEYL